MAILLNPKQIPTLSQSKISGLVSALSKKVDKVSTANIVYGTDANGDQTTYNKNDFTLVSDVLVNNRSVVNNKVANITVPTKISQLTNDNNTVVGSTDLRKIDWYDTEEEAKAASLADPTKLCFFPA